MRKTLIKTSIFLAASVFFAGYTGAQTPASGTQAPATAPASGAAPTAKAQSGSGSTGGTASKTPAAKSGTAATTAHPAFTLKTEKDKQSYAIGSNIGGRVGKEMQEAGIDVDPSVLARGIRDALLNAKPLMTDEEVKATLTALEANMKKAAEEKYAALGVANKSAGDAFLAANKSKDGIVTLPSGLQYKILKEGTGPKPTAADSVLCNYKGTLLDGTEFDSSYKRGQPVTFPVGQVIKGWTEALQLMPVGSKWELFVPSNLAYGPQPPPRTPFGPNATLVFEVELLSIQPKDAAKPAGDTGAGTAKQ